jgi:hypothetical protein
MRIGEAHRTQSSYLYSANTNGEPMHPAPIGMADRTRKKNYWLTVLREHCLLAEGNIGAPIYWRTEATNGSTVLAHFSCHIKSIQIVLSTKYIYT